MTLSFFFERLVTTFEERCVVSIEGVVASYAWRFGVVVNWNTQLQIYFEIRDDDDDDDDHNDDDDDNIFDVNNFKFTSTMQSL